MDLHNHRIRPTLEKAGFWTLLTTLFLFSYPRSWSLYALGLFLAAGSVLWLIDCRKSLNKLRKTWFLVLPPIVYFLLNLVSAVFQGASISVFESRLMFLLIPLAGFPVLYSDYVKSRLSYLFSGFTIGMVSIAIYLIVRVVYLVYINYDSSSPFLQWMEEQQQQFMSIGFSVLEHPTYMAFKVNWVLIILIFFEKHLGTIKRYSAFIIAILTLTIFLLASKAGILIWFILVMIRLIREIGRSGRPLIYIALVFVFFLITIISVREIQRIERFITDVKSFAGTEGRDWKNIDQRTREWYSAIQLIREKPLLGFGLKEVEERMVQEYLKNGWKDEADLKMNAHNQFLEAQITFGIAGLMVLIWMIINPLIFRNKSIEPLLSVAFVLLISFFLMFESMLNRQWGIMFFLIFYLIITIPDKADNAWV